MTTCLLLVLVLAKAFALAGHQVAASWWSPFVYIWQDALVAALFGIAERWLAGRRVVLWTLYAVAVAYVAVNVTVSRVLATPLTWAMLHAARGALADSIARYLTWSHLTPLVLVLAAGAAAPLVVRRVPSRATIAVLAAWTIVGWIGRGCVETTGLERNAWLTLLTTAMPRVSGVAPDVHAAAAPSGSGRDDQLERWRGAARGYNIVLISLESTASQYLGLYGAVPDPMPNLSALARHGIVYDAAYAAYPESIKGLFSILCSTFPALDVDADAYATVPCTSIAAALAAAGYRTGLFHSGRFDYLGMNAVIRGRGFGTLEDAGDIGGRRYSSFGVDEPSAVARMVDWIDGGRAGHPFFITYLPIAGHHPYESPGGPFPDDDDFGRYRNALRYGDESLGALMRAIRDRGLEERTLWIVLGDHGEAFNQHDGNVGHTFQLYEENVRVPFVIAAPGLIPAPIRRSGVISLVDTSPTVLDLVGLAAPTAYQGRSALAGGSPRARFFTDYSLPLVGLRQDRWKFVADLDTGRARLFDLLADPGERVNVADRHPQEARRFADDLRQWAAAQKDRIARAAH